MFWLSALRPSNLSQNNMTNHHFIIIGPVVTEKSLALQEKGYFSFWVRKSASKSQISQSFITVFGHKPLSVRTIALGGKIKTDWKKRLPHQLSDRKKAIIFIGKDNKIDLIKLNQKWSNLY